MLTRRQLLQMTILIPAAIGLTKVVKAQSCNTCLPLQLGSEITVSNAPTSIGLISFGAEEKTFADFIRGLFK